MPSRQDHFERHLDETLATTKPAWTEIVHTDLADYHIRFSMIIIEICILNSTIRSQTQFFPLTPNPYDPTLGFHGRAPRRRHFVPPPGPFPHDRPLRDAAPLGLHAMVGEAALVGTGRPGPRRSQLGPLPVQGRGPGRPPAGRPLFAARTQAGREDRGGQEGGATTDRRRRRSPPHRAHGSRPALGARLADDGRSRRAADARRAAHLVHRRDHGH